jgi:hypothetical protein
MNSMQNSTATATLILLANMKSHLEIKNRLVANFPLLEQSFASPSDCAVLLIA